MHCKIRKFLSKIIVAIVCLCCINSAIAAPSDAFISNIGDHGVWTTELNRNMFIDFLFQDANTFIGNFGNQVLSSIVPIEAKIGLAFMNALSHVSKILDTSLVRFVIIFIIAAYAFWVMFETYNMIAAGKGEIKKLFTEIVRKGAMIAIWTIILRYGPAQVFMSVMQPILSIATILSDLILNAVTSVAGVKIPDTCAAIHSYATAHMSPESILTADSAADLMCVPTRISGFCYAAIFAGLKWLTAGIGHSLFVTLCGALFIYLFLKIAWKFAFMALGVIADLFLAVMMLPFTAINETVGKTSYKGLAGEMFNGFLKVFNAESLKNQVDRFVKAAIYFVSLSIVIAFCAALLSSVVTTDVLNSVPTIENTGFFMAALIGALTLHFANKAMDIAKDLGGSIDKSMGEATQKDVEKFYEESKKTIKSWYKAIKGK